MDQQVQHTLEVLITSSVPTRTASLVWVIMANSRHMPLVVRHHQALHQRQCLVQLQIICTRIHMQIVKLMDRRVVSPSRVRLETAVHRTISRIITRIISTAQRLWLLRQLRIICSRISHRQPLENTCNYFMERLRVVYKWQVNRFLYLCLCECFFCNSDEIVEYIWVSFQISYFFVSWVWGGVIVERYFTKKNYLLIFSVLSF